MLSKHRLQTVFKVFDKAIIQNNINFFKDGSGAISIAELQEHFGGGKKIDDEIWK